MLAASSLLLGAAIATVRRIGTFPLGLIMAFGAGVLLSAVAFELVLPAVDHSPKGAFIGFVVGTVLFTAGDTGISRLGYANRKDINGAPSDASGLTIAPRFAPRRFTRDRCTRIDDLADGRGRCGGVGRSVHLEHPRRHRGHGQPAAGGWSVRAVFGLWTAIVLLCALASALGYAFLDGASEQVLAFMYAFAGGAILTMLATSMMPEAYENARRAAGTATVVGGMTAFWISWNFG